jgi:hypothetical protein
VGRRRHLAPIICNEIFTRQAAPVTPTSWLAAKHSAPIWQNETGSGKHARVLPFADPWYRLLTIAQLRRDCGVSKQKCSGDAVI